MTVSTDYGDLDQGGSRRDGEKWKDDGCILEAQPSEVTGSLDAADKTKAEIEVDDVSISDLNRVFSTLHFSDIWSLLYVL